MHLEQGIVSPSASHLAMLQEKEFPGLQGAAPAPGAAPSTAARHSTMQRPAGSSCSSTFLSTGRCPRASSRSYLHGH